MSFNPRGEGGSSSWLYEHPTLPDRAWKIYQSAGMKREPGRPWLRRFYGMSRQTGSRKRDCGPKKIGYKLIA
jgi:hypothetical protein